MSKWSGFDVDDAAGRYMKVYRDLRDRQPGFRERSENPDFSYEISMQPLHAFNPDGVILFSDILTPLSGQRNNAITI